MHPQPVFTIGRIGQFDTPFSVRQGNINSFYSTEFPIPVGLPTLRKTADMVVPLFPFQGKLHGGQGSKSIVAADRRHMHIKYFLVMSGCGGNPQHHVEGEGNGRVRARYSATAYFKHPSAHYSLKGHRGFRRHIEGIFIGSHTVFIRDNFTQRLQLFFKGIFVAKIITGAGLTFVNSGTQINARLCFFACCRTTIQILRLHFDVDRLAGGHFLSIKGD